MSILVRKCVCGKILSGIKKCNTCRKDLLGICYQCHSSEFEHIQKVKLARASLLNNGYSNVGQFMFVFIVSTFAIASLLKVVVL